MASVDIKTYLTNITDGSSSTTSASLDGRPFKTSAIISSRVFTKKSNTSYIVEPYISFRKTSNPNDYTYTRTHSASSGTTIFTVKYHRPLKPPTTDIIEFYGEAKTSFTASTDKFYSYKLNDLELHQLGETRNLTLYGDPYVAVKVDVTHNPKVGPEINSVSLIGGEKIVTMGSNGKYTLPIKFPSTTLLTNYRVVLTEVGSGSFPSNLPSPYTITLTQYPVAELKITLSDSALGTTLPSVADRTLEFFGERAKTFKTSFSFTVSKSVDLAVKGTFDQSDFTYTPGTSSTLDHDIEGTVVRYGNLLITIDNTVRPTTAVITGDISLAFGYDAGGHTLVTLNVNDILQNA